MPRRRISSAPRQLNQEYQKMKISKLFPSKYAKATDINKPMQLTISSVALEPMQDGKPKPVIYFNSAQKGVVCNRTNANVVAMLAKSDDTDAWSGTKVEIYADLVVFRGDVVRAIRFRAPNGQATAAAEPQAEPGNEPTSMEEELEDEIPF
jgi:hypothetical protein